jgi:predicted Zn-dependent peptidase
MPEIKSHTFPNGFRVVYQKSISSLPINHIYAFCKVGSAFETDRIRGASHFVEHMCFKGTHKRPEARKILKEFDKIGAFFNAYTEKRHTAYQVSCDDKHVHHCMDILGDVMMNSMFPKKEFIKEQKVVVEESIKSMNNNSGVLDEYMSSILFRGSSYEYPIDCLKYHPSPTFLQYDDIVEWYHWFYHPSNMVFSIVSNLSFASILAILRKTDYTKMDRHISETRPVFALEQPNITLFPVQAPNREARVVFFPKKGVSTDIIRIDFRTCSRFSKDLYSIQILRSILNGLSGRLFTALRTKHGLTYSASCSSEYREHTGYLSFSIQTDPSKIIQDSKQIGVLPIVFQLLTDLKKKGITQEELESAKGMIQGKFLLSMQSMDNIVEYNGIEMIFQEDPIVPYQDIYKTHLAKITKKDVNDVIEKYLVRENMMIGIMYEKKIDQKRIETLCKNLFV